MKRHILWLLICIPLGLYSQTKQDTTETNPRYLEDQFYAGITYNFILNLPGEPNKASQQNFSYGLQVGFIKDIPFNTSRTFGIGIGLGLGLNTYYSTIQASESNDGFRYTIVDESALNDESRVFRRSKIEPHLVEVPFELRWRNSNAKEYSFWRIYAGIKLGYVFDARSKYVEERRKNSFSNSDIRSIQYGLTFNFGYHNFNIHAYYSLTNLFNDGVAIEGNALELRPLRIGLIFYIL